MLNLVGCGLLVMLSLRGVMAMPQYYARNMSERINRLMPRQADEFDSSDLSFIRNLAAIGDSYSAGIGAGDRLGSLLGALDSKSDWACSRYSQSYPYLVYQDPSFGDTPPNWQFLSCSGAVIQDVLDKQLPDLKDGQQAIMLSIGGNDAELTNILNVYVYMWAVLDTLQYTIIRAGKILKDEKFDWAGDVDLDPLLRSCEEQLAHSASIIESDDFSSKLDSVINAAKQKLAPGGKIYWTGYAKFFATTLTWECDSVTWSTWIYKAYSPPSRQREYLTQQRRFYMNNLVDGMNKQIAAAAQRAGDQVVFVDYDKYVGDLGGRYCEAGVNESTTESNTRDGLMFYELNSWDPLGSTPWKRSTSGELQETFFGQLNIFALVTESVYPDATLATSPYVQGTMADALSAAVPGANKTTAVEQLSIADFEIPNVLPDGYGRVFHPQALLHNIIANLVVWNMMNVNEQANGYPALVQDLDMHSCPIPVQDPDPPSFYARILPLGASIVWGVGSSNGNGFRKPLRDSLRQAGWKVNMVGSQNAGSMVDNNVEAHSGDRIDQINVAADKSIKYQPNIVVINAGTNDCMQNYDIGNAGPRYGALLDKLLQQIPGVTIIVSTVLPGTVSGTVANRASVNDQIRQLVNDRRFNQNQKVVLAEVDAPATYFTTNHLVSDGIHPNDDGHQRLATIYHRAIQEALRSGYITEPKDTGMSDEPGSGSGGNVCDKVYGSGLSHGPVSTQAGSGLDDGIYSHSSQSMGVTASYQWGNMNYTFARITQPFGPQDFVIINMQYTPTDALGFYLVYPNRGDGNWFGSGVRPIEVDMPDHCIARGVRFADVNGDGLDDMLCVSPNGDTFVSINNRDNTFTGPTMWKPTEGPLQGRVRIADIDGDGRADYCTIADDGDISCWRNMGIGNIPDGWQALGVVFTGKGMGDVDGVRFADINGDGRDDWLWVDDTGKTWTWTNNRGCTKGTLAPLWRAGINSVGGAGSTHAGMGHDVGRNSIHFVNVYNSPWAFTLRGRSDYVWVEQTSTGWDFHVWKNTGGGSTKLKADGDRYCKMIDRSKNAMDYIWVHSTGYMHIYESDGGTFPAPPGPYWGNNYVFWTASDYVGHEVDRRDLHLADWDGDGLCDIIYVNPDTGVMDGVWLNQYRTTRDLTSRSNWQSITAGPHGGGGGNPPCPERRGVGIYDLAVRFADIDGDGRADYLCIEPTGRTWGYLNQGDSQLTYISQFKKPEGKDRADLRFADVNGDGRADMLALDKLDGDASVWYNRGPIPASGSAYTWDPKGAVYQGAMQGSCEHFPDLDGNGRADLHVTDSVENWATTWFNMCPGETDVSDNGDDKDTLTSTNRVL